MFPELNDDLRRLRGKAAFDTDSGGDCREATPYSSAQPPDAAKLPLPQVSGYEVQEEIGRGGMGVVYKALQVKLERIIALKMIVSGKHADPEDLARFRTEAEATARLQHPNIVQIHEVGEHDGLPFFSLEYCGGGSLEGKLNGTPLPERAGSRACLRRWRGRCRRRMSSM